METTEKQKILGNILEYYHFLENGWLQEYMERNADSWAGSILLEGIRAAAREETDRIRKLTEDGKGQEKQASGVSKDKKIGENNETRPGTIPDTDIAKVESAYDAVRACLELFSKDDGWEDAKDLLPGARKLCEVYKKDIFSSEQELTGHISEDSIWNIAREYKFWFTDTADMARDVRNDSEEFARRIDALTLDFDEDPELCAGRIFLFGVRSAASELESKCNILKIKAEKRAKDVEKNEELQQELRRMTQETGAKPVGPLPDMEEAAELAKYILLGEAMQRITEAARPVLKEKEKQRKQKKQLH